MPPHTFLNVQKGFGEGTHFGRVDFKISFCIDHSDILDGELTENESLPYVEGEGTLTASNGDVLEFTIYGVVLPTDNPNFDAIFNDPLTFIGGTGRVEDASGNGITNSFVDFSTGITHHNLTDTLNLRKGQLIKQQQINSSKLRTTHTDE